MSKQTNNTENTEQRNLREEYPSGWLALMKNQSIIYVIDALLDMPPHREFNKSELADKAGVSRQSIHRHMDLLLQAEIMEEVENTSPQRYRFDAESQVSESLIRLDGAMNAVGAESSTA